MLRRGRVVRERCVIQEVDQKLGAAVIDVVDETLVATGHVCRFEEEEVGGELDEALGVAGCVPYIDYRGVGWGVGVYGEGDSADNFLVGAGVSELEPFGEDSTLVYTQSDLGGLVVRQLLDLLGSGAGRQCST